LENDDGGGGDEGDDEGEDYDFDDGDNIEKSYTLALR